MADQHIQAIIVDDEARARRVLMSFLEEYCPDVKVLGQAGNVPDAVKLIQSTQPDLVFLDIEMPDYSGFELFRFYDKVPFQVIFITAYNEYAIQAFKVSAVDYLLKPLEIDQLVKAVEKAKSQQQLKQAKERLHTLEQNINPEGQVKNLALPVQEGLVFVEVDDIVLLEADESYTHFHLETGKLLISKKIGEFKIIENHPDFFRTHRSYLIHLNKIRQYVRQDGGYIIMKNELQVPLSRYRKEEFLKKIGYRE